jgi:hypothetical protein
MPPPDFALISVAVAVGPNAIVAADARYAAGGAAACCTCVARRPGRMGARTGAPRACRATRTRRPGACARRLALMPLIVELMHIGGALLPAPEAASIAPNIPSGGSTLSAARA